MTPQRTTPFLLANLGSEVSKIFSAKERGDIVMLNLAVAKAQSIFDELNTKEENANNKELLLLKEVIDDLITNTPKYSLSRASLQSYFFPFAIRAMGTI